MNKDQELATAYANLPNEHCTILQYHIEFGNTEYVSAMTWSCTNELRWLDESFVQERLILQQKWVSDTGEVEWRDVPTVKEDK